MALVTPPDIAVSIQRRVTVVREQMNADENAAILEIDVEEVKNDMVRGELHAMMIDREMQKVGEGAIPGYSAQGRSTASRRVTAERCLLEAG